MTGDQPVQLSQRGSDLGPERGVPAGMTLKLGKAGLGARKRGLQPVKKRRFGWRIAHPWKPFHPARFGPVRTAGGPAFLSLNGLQALHKSESRRTSITCHLAATGCIGRDCGPARLISREAFAREAPHLRRIDGRLTAPLRKARGQA